MADCCNPNPNAKQDEKAETVENETCDCNC